MWQPEPHEVTNLRTRMTPLLPVAHPNSTTSLGRRKSQRQPDEQARLPPTYSVSHKGSTSSVRSRQPNKPTHSSRPSALNSTLARFGQRLVALVGCLITNVGVVERTIQFRAARFFAMAASDWEAGWFWWDLYGGETNTISVEIVVFRFEAVKKLT